LEIKIEEGAESHDNDVRISIIREAKKNMEKEIMSLLIARYGIEENEVYAVVQINAENADAVEIERINIFLHDTSCADDVRVYVSSLFENSAEVYVMQKG
jgi:vacuolar-type H+-ATPase subunit B/Vma2